MPVAPVIAIQRDRELHQSKRHQQEHRKDEGKGELITEGIYARMRHPRYVQFLIALLGYALITNNLAVYLTTALWVPGIYLIVLLEEKELRDHFGDIYQAYCRKVPRFFPKLNRDRNRDDDQIAKPRAISRM